MDFYPRSPCGERLKRHIRVQIATPISIHALLAESDRGIDRNSPVHIGISIHALLAESDNLAYVDCQQSNAHFYPRSPCGERLCFDSRLLNSSYFYPRSPCGERRDVIAVMTDAQSISIHALLAESDPHYYQQTAYFFYFYPRSPCGERPVTTPAGAGSARDFYPRSPCGERPALLPTDGLFFLFLSTLSLRRATAHTAKNTSIAGHFYPRSPCGERQRADSLAHAPPEISIHALLAESDTGLLTRSMISINFYPRSPCGERRDYPA